MSITTKKEIVTDVVLQYAFRKAEYRDRDRKWARFGCMLKDYEVKAKPIYAMDVYTIIAQTNKKRKKKKKKQQIGIRKMKYP